MRTPKDKKAENKVNKEFADYLNAINRTYLFFCDRAFFEEFTGLKVSSSKKTNHIGYNNASRASFIKKYLAFEKLVSFAQNFQIDLKKFLNIYRDVSNDKERINIDSLLKKFFKSHDSAENTLSTVLKLLFMLNLLPRYTSKARNIKLFNIKNDIDKLLNFFENKDFVERFPELRLFYDEKNKKMNFPLLKIYRDQLVEIEKDKNMAFMSRLYLISIAVDFMEAIKCYLNVDYMVHTIKENCFKSYDLEGIYFTSDSINTNNFWYIKPNTKYEGRYLFIYYKRDVERNLFDAVCYEANTTIIQNTVIKLEVHTDKYIPDMCKYGNASNEQFVFWLNLSYDETKIYNNKGNNDTIKKLVLERVYDTRFFFPMTFYRYSGTQSSFLPKNTIINPINLSYSIIGRLYVISVDYLYFDLHFVEDDYKQLNIDYSYNYMVVARKGDFNNYDSINSNIAIIKLLDDDDKQYKYYLYLADFNRFIEIKSADSRFSFTDKIGNR